MSSGADLAALGLSLPDYGGRELGAVLPAALSAVGAGHVVRGRHADEDRVRLGLPRARHVVVVVLDGLGHLNLEERRGHAPFLRAAEQGTVTAGYPTTTAASLALFGTGQPSGQTGMTGYTARNPATGTLANLVSWEGAPEPLEWQTVPSLLEQAANDGFSVTTLGRRRFAGSGLTQAVLRGGQFVGAERLADRIDVAVSEARRPGVSYCYWGEIDAAGHKHGWQSHEWVAALEDADRELRRLAASLPAGAIMVVTADHGMVDIDGAPRWDAGTDPELLQGVVLTAGEPRALHVHVADDADVDEVAARWRARLDGHAAIWTREQAREIGLFGEIAAHVVGRIGDVVVAMAGRATVVDSRTQTEQSLGLVGVHGSLTPHELQVPLLLAGSD
ncbi:alkaline phosphatase family protein [Demequina activiva]|uniref:Nucleotide pyrophosphatase n=1 Tax=Demequina activiva TaxID=1582364 RepID=A0A919Q316_9MICO|nr:nucleotide pyrophosphatase/phosphodiesterase family protein [Demequina activiva]GIG54689.1 nucleotide pyrophosphatase [Demequina activiva]